MDAKWWQKLTLPLARWAKKLTSIAFSYTYSSIIWTFFLWSHWVIVSVSTNSTLILKIICQCYVKHIMMLPIEAITWIMKVSTSIIIGISAHPVRLAVILVVMYVSTFISTVILYISVWWFYYNFNGECFTQSFSRKKYLGGGEGSELRQLFGVLPPEF